MATDAVKVGPVYRKSTGVITSGTVRMCLMKQTVVRIIKYFMSADMNGHYL